MSDRRWKLIAAIFIMTMAIPYEMYSQEHSIGTSWSFSGIGADYRHRTGRDTFLWVQAKLEMTEIFQGNASVPGASASVSWNSMFAGSESASGSSIMFYAGPGITAGYCRDYGTGNGVFWGLQGRAGVQIAYDRNAEICIGIAPVIGMHLISDASKTSVKCYRYGLLQTIMPEISISYRF